MLSSSEENGRNTEEDGGDTNYHGENSTIDLTNNVSLQYYTYYYLVGCELPYKYINKSCSKKDQFIISQTNPIYTHQHSPAGENNIFLNRVH